MVDKTSVGEVVREQIDIPSLNYCSMVLFAHVNDDSELIFVIFQLHNFKWNIDAANKSITPTINSFETYLVWIVTVSWWLSFRSCLEISK